MKRPPETVAFLFAFKGGLKGVAHLEGSGQEATHIIHPSLCQWGGVWDSGVARRLHARVTQSHPGCHRQQCRLQPEPHQSPLRIKAWERALTGLHSGPGHHGAPDNGRYPAASTQ